jgi:nickel/cobalt transporter (NicO) family protein
MTRRLMPLFVAALAAAHPMGNFSVSHFTRLHVTTTGVEVTYVLDLAEVPAYELLKSWKLDPSSPPSTLDARANDQAREWMSSLQFRSAGKILTPTLTRASIRVTPVAGGLFVARVESILHLDAPAADLEFADTNYPDRPGWKEIVIDVAPGESLVTASQGAVDRSRALTEYPSGAAAPGDLRARVSWRPGDSTSIAKIIPIPQPAPVPTEETPRSSTAPVQRDFLSSLLARRDLGWGLMLIGLAVAFGLGAIHAMSPGHGKTIVAAYLVGSRGAMRHAAFLGAMVTFTHTASVFALGLATLFLSKFFVPERMAKGLEAISGLSIVAIGAWLFYKRLQALRVDHPSPHVHHDHDHPHHDHDHHHDHHHDHDHHHHHHHDHDHPHDHHHDHDHPHDHDHDHAHSHLPQGDVTLGSLIALGASGGLVPCPSAMVLLLFAISVGRVGLGLLLLVAFSIGLASVLMAIGMLVLYAKNWLPDPARTSRHRAFRFLPVVSAAVIVCIGLVMTGVSVR